MPLIICLVDVEAVGPTREAGSGLVTGMTGGEEDPLVIGQLNHYIGGGPGRFGSGSDDDQPLAP